jgi:hypothetical protein
MNIIEMMRDVPAFSARLRALGHRIHRSHQLNALARIGDAEMRQDAALRKAAATDQPGSESHETILF